MTITKLNNVEFGEAFHLFEVMEKHSLLCSLEFKLREDADPFMSIVSQPVKSDFIERTVDDGGDAMQIDLGETSLLFSVSECYGKQITKSQISLCIANETYAAWFSTEQMSPEAIADAHNYIELTGSEDEIMTVNVMSDDFEAALIWLTDRIREGRVIKNVKVLEDGNQILTVGYTNKGE
nr:hypothetical protein [Paenibacillus xylanexedens]